MKRAVILGLGYTGARFAARLRAQGWDVVGTTRKPGGLALEQAGHLVRNADAVLATIPPGEAGDPALATLGPELAAATGWIGYLSTTGAYGDRKGRWAFEDDPPTPKGPEGERRVAAESAWRAVPNPAHVFRLPGIYGPGRSGLDQIRAGTAKRLSAGVVTCRVHVDDIVSGLLASIARPSPGRIYNLSDDWPCESHEATAFAAALLGEAPPPLQPYDPSLVSPAGRRFFEQSRRVSNARAKAELGWRPSYRSYREGLTAILAQELAGAAEPT
jgi:nucleoside-diphosphate-sugar epimerase